MSTISTLIYQYLSSSFSGLDWKQGSVVRELVAEPVVGLVETANSIVNDVYAQLDIQTLLDNPTEYNDEIDQLFTTLGLSEPDPTQSTGTVKILTSDNTPFTLAAGTTFTYQDYSLATGGMVRITPTPSEPDDIKLYQLGINSYYAVVPVSTTGNSVNIGVGAELNWTNLSPSIYSVVVASTITGGISAYTSAQKINAIRQLLFPQVLTCREGILRAINNALPNSTVDCVFATNNLSSSANAEVFVKTVAAPQYWEIIPAAAANKVNVSEIGVATVVSVNNDPDIDFNVVRNRRTLQIIALSNSISIESVQVYGLATLPQIQQTLDNFTSGTGMTLDLRAPTLLNLSVNMPVGAGMVTNDLLANISDIVNNTLLDTSIVGDTLLKPVFNAGGVTTPYAGTYTLKDGVTNEVSQALVSCDAAPFMRYGKPFAIYTTVDQVSYNLNV